MSNKNDEKMIEQLMTKNSELTVQLLKSEKMIEEMCRRELQLGTTYNNLLEEYEKLKTIEKCNVDALNKNFDFEENIKNLTKEIQNLNLNDMKLQFISYFDTISRQSSSMDQKLDLIKNSHLKSNDIIIENPIYIHDELQERLTKANEHIFKLMSIICILNYDTFFNIDSDVINECKKNMYYNLIKLEFEAINLEITDEMKNKIKILKLQKKHYKIKCYDDIEIEMVYKNSINKNRNSIWNEYGHIRNSQVSLSDLRREYYMNDLNEISDFYDKEISYLKDKIENQKGENERYAEKIKNLSNEVNKKENEIKKGKERKCKLKEDLIKLEEQLDYVINIDKELSIKLMENECEIDEKKQMIKELKDKIMEKENKIKIKEEEIDILESNVKQYRRRSESDDLKLARRSLASSLRELEKYKEKNKFFMNNEINLEEKFEKRKENIRKAVSEVAFLENRPRFNDSLSASYLSKRENFKLGHNKQSEDRKNRYKQHDDGSEEERDAFLDFDVLNDQMKNIDEDVSFGFN